MRAVALVGLLACASCTVTERSIFDDVGVDTPALTEAQWNAARQSAADPATRRFSLDSDDVETRDDGDSGSSFWVIPGWNAGRLVRADRQSRVLVHEQATAGLIDAAVLRLPLWWSTERALFLPDGRKARNDFAGSLFWTSSHADDWPDDVPRLESWGVPLLYAGFASRGGPQEETMHSLLWVLGPMWQTYDGAGPDATRGWAFDPLALGGLGGLLWRSCVLSTPVQDEVAHGPLFGYLGWWSRDRSWIVDPGDDGTRLLTRVRVGESSATAAAASRRDEHIFALLGGLLWFDDAMREGGVPRDETHGPLFGMFGWGREEGEPVLRLFWFGIPL
ncbi:MAG: hypothetical protein H6825_10280 [Planctomycetes bacterium]|nr:hypothetical protein [Planctomycetota bacterium]